ncbi:FHA domain-containing protein [Bacteroides finegoldii]|uniref:FHA domain-containing protein n=1 Tax=Bacteroides finegoldii TaxID=338188 RepID=UPI00189D9981|nr:FHA domain-containing protein [Bacteroides finegoldii]
MATKKCANGHQYDASIYGDNCPFCPSGSTKVNPETGGTHTSVWPPIDDNITGKTKPIGDSPIGGGATVIRHATPTGETSLGGQNRKLVGLLVSYDSNPLGEVYKIYEGRNLAGRAVTCDIALTIDNNISSAHLLILYREAEGIFWAVDQNSSNGTYINGKFISDKVQLQTNDIIVLGATKLIFLAIPTL